MVDNDIFFPVRYEKSRPFIDKFCALSRNRTHKEIFNDSFQMTIQNMLFDNMVEAEQKFPTPVPVSEQSFNLKLSRELNFFWFYYQWQHSGRNIFHFTKELLELFDNTDVDQVPLDVIQFPFKSFYISLSDLDRQFAIDTDGNEYFIDGVFIIKNFANENQIDLFFNGLNKEAKLSKNWLWGNYASLVGDWYRINYSQEKNTLRTAGYLPKFLKDNPHEAAKEATRMFFANMVNLVFNALCYLSSKQEIPKVEFPKDTPQHLITNLKNAKTKHQKDIINSELKRKGFTKVNFVGQSFTHSRNSIDNTGKSVATHWRRGFWRNQAHGPGLKEHTLKWIKPTIVNKDKGEAIKGRIYEA